MADLKVTQIYSLLPGSNTEDPKLDWLPITRQNSENSDARTTLRMPYPRGDADIQSDCTICSGEGTVEKLIDGERVTVDCDHCGGTGIEPSGSVSVDEDGVITVHTDGESITVEGGKLTAHGTYEAGTAISIEDNTIGVKIDGETVKTNDAGELAVNISEGDGIAIDDGEVSVNIGSGLAINAQRNDVNVKVDGVTIKVNESNELESAVAIEPGEGIIANGMKVSAKISKGLEFDSSKSIAVKIDDDTIKTDATGHLYVNADVSAGDGISVLGHTVSVNAADKGAINVSPVGVAVRVDDDTIKIGDDNRLYVSKNVSEGDGIVVDGDTVSAKLGAGLEFDNKKGIAVKVDGQTIKYNPADGKLHSHIVNGDGINLSEPLNKVSVKVNPNSAVTVDANGVAIAVDDETIKVDPTTKKLTVTKTPEAGDGISVDENTVSVKLGDGLDFDATKNIKVVTDGDTVTIDNGKLTAHVTEGDGITVGESNEVSVKAAENGGIDVSASGVAVKIDDSTIKIGEDGKLYANAPEGRAGDGLTIKDGAYTVVAGDGIQVSADGVSVNIDGTSIVADGDGVLSAKTEVHAGYGLKVNEAGDELSLKIPSDGVLATTDGGVDVNVGTGLKKQNGKIAIDLDDGEFTTAVGNKVNVNIGSGLTEDSNKIAVKVDGTTVVVNKDGFLQAIPDVKAGNGIDIDEDYRISAKVGDGLKISPSGDISAKVDGATIVSDSGTLKSGFVGKNGIDITGNEVSAKLGDALDVIDGKISVRTDNDTVVVEDGVLKSVVEIEAGTAISVTDKKVSVKVGAGLDVNASDEIVVLPDNSTIKVQGGVVKGAYVGDDGVDVTGNVISAKVGKGLNINGDNEIVPDVDGVTVKIGEDGMISATCDLTQGAGITIADKKVSVKAGNSLVIDPTTGLEVDVDNKTIVIADGKVSGNYKAGFGLVMDEDTTTIEINPGKGLEVNGADEIQAKIDDSTIKADDDGTLYVSPDIYKAGSGIIIDNGEISVKEGSGVTVSSSGVSVNVDNVTIGVNDAKKLYGKYVGKNGIAVEDGKIGANIGAGLNVDGTNKINVVIDPATDATDTGFWTSKTTQAMITQATNFTPAYLIAKTERTKLECTGERLTWTMIDSRNVTTGPDRTFKVGDDEAAIINEFKFDVTFTIECPSYLTNASEFIISMDLTSSSETNAPDTVNEVPATHYYLDTTKQYSTFTLSGVVTRDLGYAPYFGIFLYPITASDDGEVVPDMYITAKIEGVGF